MFETETEIADRGKVKGGARVPAKRQGEKNFGMTARICEQSGFVEPWLVEAASRLRQVSVASAEAAPEGSWRS